MYKIELNIDIFGPAPKTPQTGLFSTFKKEIELNFVPFAGLVLGIEPNVQENDQAIHLELFAKVKNKTDLFIIDTIYHYLPNFEGKCTSEHDFEIMLESLHEDTEENFYSLEKYLTYYGFEKIH